MHYDQNDARIYNREVAFAASDGLSLSARRDSSGEPAIICARTAGSGRRTAPFALRPSRPQSAASSSARLAHSIHPSMSLYGRKQSGRPRAASRPGAVAKAVTLCSLTQFRVRTNIHMTVQIRKHTCTATQPAGRRGGRSSWFGA